VAENRKRIVAKKSSSNPNVELSKAMFAILQRRAEGEAYPCTLRSLAVEARADVSDEEILAALGSNPLKKESLAAFADHPDSLVALKADKERLAADDRILRELLSRMCSPELPHVPVDSLIAELAAPLRAPFTKEWKRRIKVRSLPQFVGFVLVKPVTGKGKGQEELHDVRFSLPWVALSEKLVEHFSGQQRERVTPFTLTEIVNAASGEPASLVRKAMETEPFCSEVRSIRKDGELEWFALSHDASRIVTGDEFLEKLIHSACTVEVPEAKLSALKKQVPKDLQSAFVDHWLAVVNRGESKGFFGIVTATTKDLTFRDTRFPKPEAVLSQKLLAALRSLKADEPGSYPTTFSHLRSRVGPEAGILVAGRAASLAPYSSEVITAFPTALDSPIGLAEDVQQIAESSLLLSVLLPKHIKPEQQVVSVTALARTKGLHAAVQPFVEAAVEQVITSNSLPSALGALRISGKWNLFFQKDVTGSSDPSSDTLGATKLQPGLQTEKSTSSSVGAEKEKRTFADDFITAFEKLDRESSFRNYLKLLDLRLELQHYDRTEFDRGIMDLCRKRQFGLEGSEGSTVKLTDEERAAGIIDGGSLLVYCRRRK
jgi:hypothetical protein